MVCKYGFCFLIFFNLLYSSIECKGVISKGGGGGKSNNNKKGIGFHQDSGINSGSAGGYFDISQSYLRSEESILRAYLMSNYTYDVRPVVNASTVTYVNITLTIIQIMDLDEQNQVMITNAQIALKWKDEHLVWDPEEFDNQTRMVLSSKDIWTPDIVLFNSADVAYSTQRDNYLIDVASDGTVTWMFPDILRSYCRVDIKYFPFDRQNCTLELQSWARNKQEVYVFHDENPYMNHSFINTEWRLLNINVQPGEQNNFVWLEFTLYLKRNHAFYVNHMIFPFTILSSLTLFVFWLPPDSGEKITLTITILLALTVFLQLITEYTPKAAKTLPIIGLYFNINLILVLVSVILTIIVLNFHFRGPKKRRVPKWMRHLIIGHMGRLFCFCYESRAYYMFQEEIKEKDIIDPPYTLNTTSAKDLSSIKKSETTKNYSVTNTPQKYQSHTAYIPKNCTKRTSDSDSASEGFLNQIEPAYVKVSRNERDLIRKENHIVLEYSNETDRFVSGNLSENMNTKPSQSSNIVSSPQRNKSANTTCNHVKKSNNNIRQFELPFNEDITKNLEKMLIKMQKSFDPFKLKDENLKFSIVKEILECQRLLLTVNLSNNKEINYKSFKGGRNKSNKKSSKNEKHSSGYNREMTPAEIYDEWKILAMIVDRICFFFYLLALVLSSGLFFLREQVYNDDYNG